MSASLSTLDIAQLAAEPTVSLRVELAAKMAADLSSNALTPSEIQLGYEIASILARDVEESVRASLARGLRHAQTLPRDLARKLADDVEQVAHPILTDSLVLTDEDLVGIVQRGSYKKQEVIANRPNLTELVADALITHAGEPAVAVLMGNDTAAIADASFDRAVTRFAGSDQVKEAMVMRGTLPPVVAERLVTMVSNLLQARLVDTHDLAPETVAGIVTASRETATIRLSLGASDKDLYDMATAMQVNGRLTPTLIMRALYAGDVAFFEAAMAVKSEIPLSNARILIHDTSRRGLEALCKKASMPEAVFEVVRAAVEVASETNSDGAAWDLERFRSRVITRVLTMTDNVDSEAAAPMLDKLWEVLIDR